ncbi:MAG TPA: decaprenyl-phosphate phosphoribosyltransferase [Vicinamibacterales bacterium]
MPSRSVPSASPVPASAAVTVVGHRAFVTNLVKSLRPQQWTKNLLVFAGLIFAQRLFDARALTTSIGAFAVFCGLSSVVYLVNDLSDRDADRLHPTKALRPIASGALAPAAAWTAAAVLGVAAMAGALAISRPFAVVGGVYLVLLSAYSAWLKHLVILDVLTLASGFVLRAVAGAVAIDVPFSNWLLLMTLLLALFIGLSKRRAELVTMTDRAASHRRILAEYSPYLLDQMIGVVTASTLIAYAFYTISPDVVQHFGTDRLIYTVPFVIYGIFRYLYLIHQRDEGGNPSELLVTDRPILACVALWGAAMVMILYG